MTVPIGNLFPEFALPDLEGRTWQRSELVGSRAVVFCFATW
jgi:peroxiredoxin